MRVMFKYCAWLLMLLAAVAVAYYSISLAMHPENAPGFLREGMLSGQLRYYFHFIFGATALVCGALQFLSWLRLKLPVLHRNLGKLYLLSILISGTAALIMSLQAQGGIVSVTGFSLLAILWLYTSYRGYQEARKGNFSVHRQWMVRSYALTLAAVTLRLYLGLALGVLQLDFETAYVVIAWACWLPNLIIAELCFNRPAMAKEQNHQARLA
ncbi:DUF2306 domain-containing protein [Aliiglaciecola sp. CAU 1673]|uniref:DUF2306 domain-containing protein n=1 Tax=Aliiglaciecola sp. CAU 1673 TaxID=3032595 RepID=UPI0023DB29C1|nr:DUF2306 domain-containing protein [Aliiglaciecola sp. CAU 1673]MDF2178186.1 DUF2306 domain-containing protein [Aliiglaciecola sp. CAU 1673]